MTASCKGVPKGALRKHGLLHGASPTIAGRPGLGPRGAHTHGSTRVSAGRPQARACSLSWKMGSVLRTLARPLPGTSTAGRGRRRGVRGWQPPPAPTAAGPPRGSAGGGLWRGPRRGPLAHLQNQQWQVASSNGRLRPAMAGHVLTLPSSVSSLLSPP